MSLEPLNKKERAKAQRRFLWVYILSIIIPCIAVYFLARSSDSRLASENSQLRSLLRLVTAMDSVGQQTKILTEIDNRFKNSSEKVLNSQDQLAADNSEMTLRSVINALKRDSAGVVSAMAPPNREPAANIIANLGLYLQNWITIKDLRKSIKNQGIDVSALENCQAKLEAAQNKVSEMNLMMAALAANKPAPPPPAAKSGGGGGDTPKMDLFCEAKVVKIEGVWLKKAADEGKSPRKDAEILKFYKQSQEKYQRLLDITRIQPALSNYRNEAENALLDLDRKIRQYE